MMFELISVALSCAIMSLYLTAYILHWGIPCSISDTYYKLERKWLFPVCTAFAGALTLVPLLNNTPESYQFVAFFIIAAILFVAAAPAFKEEFVDKIHAGAAAVLGICALAWLIMTTGVPYIAIVAAVTAVFDRKHFLFWIEAGLLYNLYLQIIMTITMNIPIL